ncbi:MAG: ABC transporter permease, partial [Kiritimatiellales bacterium]|nr:ABC transporter permease [Kiritimatiellales bacterium]
ILNSLRFYWRSHLGVLLGTVLAAAVLTGSLLVGDSVGGSLRSFALQRLGGIHYALNTPNRFFASELADELRAEVDGAVAAVLHLRGMALANEKQVNQVQVMGSDACFWEFSANPFVLAENETAINEKLATALGVVVGGEVSLRVSKPGLLPRDAPLSSQKDAQTVRGRFTVKRILSDQELGRFSLLANQVVPYNAFVNARWLEDKTELVGKANMILAGKDTTLEKLDAAVSKVWKPEQLGLRFRDATGVVQLESARIYLGPETVRAAQSISGARGTLTYLVNSVSKGSKSTPYSFMAAGPVPAGMADNEMVISRWLADQLGAGEGDAVKIKYFSLLPSGKFEERERSFMVHSIMEMDMLAAERTLAPQFPGLTDVDRCTEWDVGMPMDEKLLEDEANEDYWDKYKQTPKALVTLKAGQEMWSNRFGALSSVRWDGDAAGIRASFMKEFDPVKDGLVFQPVREQALSAVNEAMDFGQLFVGMSFFLIVAALMLTGLLFVFGVQQRAEEMGTLLALGWKPGLVRALYLGEGGVIALLGSLAGAWAGTGYTRFLIWGLSRYWQGAVANSAIQYFAKPETIAIGAVSSFACALAAMAVAMWRQARHPARELLMADFSQEFQPLEKSARKIPMVGKLFPTVGILAAVGIVVYALAADVESVTMPFFGAGGLLLVSGILFFGELFNRMGRLERLPDLKGMALRNLSRRRGRSLTVIGLLACGCFMVFAVSSMKEDVTAHADESWSGTGGFAYFGQSTLPITEDFGGVRIRVRDGDDASCLNLNRAQSPRLLGVNPDALAARKAFLADEDLWQLLKLKLPDGAIPALVGDADTAMWGLEKKTGVEKGDLLTYRVGQGNEFSIKLVGTLPMRLSVFQGTILISDKAFTEKFPAEEGFRMFLLNGTAEDQDALVKKLDRTGLDVVPATERLMEFYAVESTYLAMFLVLGVLGLVVGSMGMGIVVLRNVLERRCETALLHAVGYRRKTLRNLLLMEHGVLLVAGLGLGVVASSVAMVPALFISQSKVSGVFLTGLLVAVAACGAVCMVVAVGFALRGDSLRGLRNE